MVEEFFDELKEELYETILAKLNGLLADEEFIKDMKYYFEPASDAKSEGLFTFTNPFNKKTITFLWHSIYQKIQILRGNEDKETLQEFKQALEHIEEKHLRNKQVPERDNWAKQFLDFYEDERELIVILEIPPETDDEIELQGSPHELEVWSGEFHRKVHLMPRVDPDSAKAKFSNNMLEVRFKKVPKRAKIKITVKDEPVDPKALQDPKAAQDLKAPPKG